MPGRRRDRTPPGSPRVGGDEPRRLQLRRVYQGGRESRMRAAAPVPRLRRVAGPSGKDRGAPGAGDRRRRGPARLAGVLWLPLLPSGAPARESVRLQPLAAADAAAGRGGGAQGEPGLFAHHGGRRRLLRPLFRRRSHPAVHPAARRGEPRRVTDADRGPRVPRAVARHQRSGGGLPVRISRRLGEHHQHHASGSWSWIGSGAARAIRWRT